MGVRPSWLVLAVLLIPAAAPGSPSDGLLGSTFVRVDP